jgi:hypothetical protein
MTSPGRLVIGIGLVGLGAIYLMDAAGWLDGGDVVSRWWPAVLIGVGVVQILADRSNWLGPGFLILLGVVFLGQRNDVLGDNVWTYIWPIGLIALGAWILVGRGTTASTVGDGTLGIVAVLAGRDAIVAGMPFRGGDATVVLGSANVDLTEADIGEGVTITATVMLGSLNILVPEGWRVSFTGTPLLGSWDDTTRRDTVPDDAPRLEIRALVILGGIEVRHAERWQ